ncbi:MAG: polysaccharide biosynthesis C-terminal domain-containing protein [[Clostridium] leptum]
MFCSGMFGGVFNIILNLILIPLIGVNIATCISYILVFYLDYFTLESILNIE